jgi:hypothetical protein
LERLGTLLFIGINTVATPATIVDFVADGTIAKPETIEFLTASGSYRSCLVASFAGTAAKSDVGFKNSGA